MGVRSKPMYLFCPRERARTGQTCFGNFISHAKCSLYAWTQYSWRGWKNALNSSIKTFECLDDTILKCWNKTHRALLPAFWHCGICLHSLITWSPLHAVLVGSRPWCPSGPTWWARIPSISTMRYHLPKSNGRSYLNKHYQNAAR